jgi:hypothetical protein
MFSMYPIRINVCQLRQIVLCNVRFGTVLAGFESPGHCARLRELWMKYTGHLDEKIQHTYKTFLVV